jgi:hypothetical protein
MTNFFFSLTVVGFVMWGALSDERTGNLLYNCFWALSEQ